MIISTGSRSLDGILGGGIRSGMVTDFFGGSGTGKSQLCFTVCVNGAKEINPGESILFIIRLATLDQKEFKKFLKAKEKRTY